jgi:hypothetical protein
MLGSHTCCWFIRLCGLVAILFCTLHITAAAKILEDLCTCSHTLSTSDTYNAVILSATGRVGSSNLLSMLGSHKSIQDVGEIFISSKFHSQKLPPDASSPKLSPASAVMKQRIVAHIRQSLLPKKRITPASASASLEGVLSVRRISVASVKFWHAWELVCCNSL